MQDKVYLEICFIWDIDNEYQDAKRRRSLYCFYTQGA